MGHEMAQANYWGTHGRLVRVIGVPTLKKYDPPTHNKIILPELVNGGNVPKGVENDVRFFFFFKKKRGDGNKCGCKLEKPTRVFQVSHQAHKYCGTFC